MGRYVLPMQQITDQIRQGLQDQGRSPAWLSEATGIPRETLRRRLANPGQFSLADLDRIATALGISAFDLLAGEVA